MIRHVHRQQLLVPRQGRECIVIDCCRIHQTISRAPFGASKLSEKEGSQRHTFTWTCSLLNDYLTLCELCSAFVLQNREDNPFAGHMGLLFVSIKECQLQGNEIHISHMSKIGLKEKNF